MRLSFKFSRRIIDVFLFLCTYKLFYKIVTSSVIIKYEDRDNNNKITLCSIFICILKWNTLVLVKYVGTYITPSRNLILLHNVNCTTNIVYVCIKFKNVHIYELINGACTYSMSILGSLDITYIFIKLSNEKSIMIFHLFAIPNKLVTYVHKYILMFYLIRQIFSADRK